MSEFIPRWSHRTRAVPETSKSKKAKHGTDKTDKTAPNNLATDVDHLATGKTGRTASVGLRAGQATGKTSNTVSAISSIPDVEAMPLHEFAEAGLILSVWSDVLETEVIFVSNNVPKSTLEERHDVAYRASELSQLPELNPSALRLVHEIKNLFGGIITCSGRKPGRDVKI